MRFFLLGSFSEAVLVVSILGMVYDCQLQVVLQAWGGYPFFIPFMSCVQSLGLGAAVRFVFQGLSYCKLSVALSLWFRF